jgi:hypothetical protein
MVMLLDSVEALRLFCDLQRLWLHRLWGLRASAARLPFLLQLGRRVQRFDCDP